MVNTRRVLKTSNDVGVREELNTNKVNEFMESVNNGSTVDDVETDNTYIEIDQIMERAVEQKCMLEEIVRVMTSGE